MFILLLAIAIAPVFAEDIQSTLAQRSGLSLTVYNENLSLISDKRKLNIEAGEGHIRFMDVAQQVEPASIQINSESSSKDFTVREQVFEFRPMDRNALLNAYIGKTVKIIDWNQYKDTRKVTEAVLLSNTNGPIYRIGNEVFLDNPGTIVLPELPAGFTERPAISWAYAAKDSRTVPVTVSYLTFGLGWQADYNLKLNQDNRSGGLQAWITARNDAGTDFKNADMTFVAGKPNMERQGQADMAMVRRAKSFEMASAPAMMAEEPIFEYHSFPLGRKADLNQNETRQFDLLSSDAVSLRKELVFTGVKTHFIIHHRPTESAVPLDVWIRFGNSKDNRLGVPLPQGTVRVYQQDRKGAELFLGEDRLPHTAKNAEVKIRIGKAFDVTGERKQMDFREVSTRLYESEWQITLRNAKDEPVDVAVIEPLYSNWKILSSSAKYKKVDAFTVRFDQTIPANKQVELKYRIQVGLE